MASGRINYSRSSLLGGDIASLMQAGVNYRKLAGEMDRKLSRYNDANAAIAADSGMSEGDVQGFKDLVKLSAQETAGLLTETLSSGGGTRTKTLLDSMG